MTAARSEPMAGSTRPPLLGLEIPGQGEKNPILMPVRIQNLSMETVTLAVPNPWRIANWDRLRGRDCVLRVEDPGGQELVKIKAKIAWSKISVEGRSALSLGLLLTRPSGEALKRLSGHVTHTSPDVKELWERYDQVRQIPVCSRLVNNLYLAGLVLLVAGVAVQFIASPSFKLLGWGLWFLGSLAIAGKLMGSFRHKQASR
jgi:hypothetical protein